MTATLLAFDTSTETMSVAVQSAQGVSAWNGEGGARTSATLLPRIRLLLQEHALAMGALDAIAFGAGPGAFTGLRTACSVAQGLAFGASRPVLPIDSLLIVAEDARVQAGAKETFDVGVAMDARMGELYAARYRWHAGAWVCSSAPMLCGPMALAHWWGDAGPQSLAGNGLHLLPAPPQTPVLAQVADRAAALMRLAVRASAAGVGIDAAQALPVYLRDKVASTTAERAAKASA